MTLAKVKQFLAEEEKYTKELGIDFSATRYGRTWSIGIDGAVVTCVPTSAVPYTALGMINVARHNMDRV